MNIDESGCCDQIFGGNDLIESSGNIAVSDLLDFIVKENQKTLQNIDSGRDDAAMSDQSSHSTLSKLILSVV